MRDLSDWYLLDHLLLDLDSLDDWDVLDDLVRLCNLDSLHDWNFLDDLDFLDNFNWNFDSSDDLDFLDDLLNDWDMLDDLNLLDDFDCERKSKVKESRKGLSGGNLPGIVMVLMISIGLMTSTFWMTGTCLTISTIFGCSSHGCGIFSCSPPTAPKSFGSHFFFLKSLASELMMAAASTNPIKVI